MKCFHPNSVDDFAKKRVGKLGHNNAEKEGTLAR
jgi:hypothetical protein